VLTLPTATRTLPTERPVLWIQVVASKSVGAAHVVRCYGPMGDLAGGMTCSNCKGFEMRGTCSHLAQEKLQEAREALAQAALKPAVKAVAIVEPVVFICDEQPLSYEDRLAQSKAERAARLAQKAARGQTAESALADMGFAA
jgi:hypothetical protein